MKKRMMVDKANYFKLVGRDLTHYIKITKNKAITITDDSNNKRPGYEIEIVYSDISIYDNYIGISKQEFENAKKNAIDFIKNEGEM